MGLKLEDLEAKEFKGDIDCLGEPGKGLQLGDLLNIKEGITFLDYLSEEDWFDEKNCYVLDVESYSLNSMIRSIQIFDTQVNRAYYLIHGRIEDKLKIHNKINSFGVDIEFREFDSEVDLISSFFEFLIENPKPILGHNISHFDLALLDSKKRYYDISGLKFYNYRVGSGVGYTNQYFSFELTKLEEGEEKYRYPICDTLHIAFNLHIPGKLSELSKDTDFPKKEVDYRVFEKEVLGYDEVVYSIFDCLSIPSVLNNLRAYIQPIQKYLKVERKASQLIHEHIWMKGAGSVADAYLNKSLGRLKSGLPDYETCWFGGLTRAWKPGFHKPEGNKKIRYLDLSSAYVFSIAKQKVLDIAEGDYVYVTNQPYSKEIYNKLIFSADLWVKAKKRCYVLKEVENLKDKIKNGKWQPQGFVGFGFIRSFDKESKIQDIQHGIGFLEFMRGDETILTKTEYEINKAWDSDFEKNVKIVRIEEGLYCSNELLGHATKNYLDLYKKRKELKEKGDKAEKGFKEVNLSVYGKTAQATGEWFNLAIAASVTGFVRYQLFSLVCYAQRHGIEVLYSDTDSLYVKASDKQIQGIINYADKLNDIPLLYGDPNLKDENEDIRGIWVQKRKRYIKVLREGDKNIVKVVGENGHGSLRWRDILFRLVCLTGEYSIEGIKNKIQSIEEVEDLHKPDTERFERFCKDVFDKYKDKPLNDIFQVETESDFDEENQPLIKTKAIIGMKENIHFKSKTSYPIGTVYHYFKEAWESEVNKRYLDSQGVAVEDRVRLRELKNELTQLRKQLKKDSKYINREGDSNYRKWKEFFDLVLEIYEGGEGEYGEYIADSWENEFFSYHFRKLGLKEKTTKGYLELFENLRAYYSRDELISKLNEISPEKIVLEDGFDIKSIQESFDYYSDLKDNIKGEIEELEDRVKEACKGIKKIEAYPGCFFSINRDYSFEDKEFNSSDFRINYLAYAEEEDRIPIFKVRDYNKILFQELNIDTVVFRSRASLNIKGCSNPKKVTKAAFKFPHNGKKRHANFFLPGLFLRMRIDDLNKGEYTILNKSKKDYANINIFIQNINRLEAIFRVNKVRMLCPKPNLFSLYSFYSKISNFMQKWIENEFEKNGVKLDFPRFSFIQQIDISQESDEKFAFEMNKETWGKPFPTYRQNESIQAHFSKYLAISIYDKKRSALRKIEEKGFTESEEDYFREESKEGWRSEIKFKLTRNFYESLSYAFILNQIEQESFLDFVKDSNTIYKRKAINVELNSRIEGLFVFGRLKVVILFSSRFWVKGCIIIQVMGSEGGPSPLEGSWVSTMQSPPPPEGYLNIIENFGKDGPPKVRWRLVFDKFSVINKERDSLYKEEIMSRL